MTIDLLMPKLGLTMSEGVLLEWKVAPGERIGKGQVLYVVETDKVATEVEAETDGALTDRLVAEGETVAVGTVVGRMAEDGTAKAPPKPAAPLSPAPPPPPAARPGKASKAESATRIVATPLARRTARERSVDLAKVEGTGPRGRIKLIDVERASAASALSPVARPEPADSGRRMKPSSMQAAMARRLSEVKHGVPHFYLASEVEVSSLLRLRETLNADRALPRLTLNHFVVAAVGRALLHHPNINLVWADGEILAFEASDVSVAVETAAGLLVPVVRDAGTKSLDAIAAQSRDLIEKAHGGRLSTAELSGGSVAVSNAGMHDVTWLTPIINPGQSAILGVGSVREIFRPDENGAPALRREMGLVLSADHRVHTGVEGLAFLNSIKALLGNPLRLLRRG